VRLITPPEGTVLDHFAGSGTTGEACSKEGMGYVLIEKEAQYIPLIHSRLSQPSLFEEL
jgi:site-specific DNA-methyltransferase (adenine-specific)